MSRGPARILDEYLVASSKVGDSKAFALLAERWHGKLVAHAWRLTGDREAARDAAQEGWIEIVHGLRHLRDERAFPAWAYRIVSRRCARLVGDSIRRRELGEALSGESPPREAEAVAEAAVDSKLLRAEIAMLPPDQKSAIALFYLEEMSVAEVAVALDAPVGTIKTRLMHARRKLRLALEGDD